MAEKTIAEVPLVVSDFGEPYKNLFDKAAAGGFEVWLAYFNNNFNNPTAKADQALYDKMGWWAEIFRDKVFPRSAKKGEVTNGKLPLLYIANAGTEAEQEIDVLAPKNGWYVMTDSGIFVQNTLIPFQTVGDKGKAKENYENNGFPKEQVSYFYRLDSYDSERFVGRVFRPGVDDRGRFLVYADWSPSSSGNDRVGVRSADE